jgi:hypothetical protein
MFCKIILQYISIISCFQSARWKYREILMFLIFLFVILFLIFSFIRYVPFTFICLARLIFAKMNKPQE